MSLDTAYIKAKARINHALIYLSNVKCFDRPFTPFDVINPKEYARMAGFGGKLPSIESQDSGVCLVDEAELKQALKGDEISSMAADATNAKAEDQKLVVLDDPKPPLFCCLIVTAGLLALVAAFCVLQPHIHLPFWVVCAGIALLL